MINIAKPLIGKEEQDAILEVINSGMMVQGARVREFESRFAQMCGAEHAIATSSGTTALHIALLAHEIGTGDEVITSPFSFIASANCALYVGARPIFADIEPDYFTIDPIQIRKRITPRTKAILPVHLYGQACDMDAILEIAHEHKLAIIEDACQAHGATYKGRPVGSFGTACYSLYATKNITTIEGGMIVTNDAQVAERARLLRNHGSPRTYEHVSLGYNMRTTDLAAAIGLVQLEKLRQWNDIRRENAAYLSEHLAKIPGVVVPKVREGCEHIFHQYTIRIPDRDASAQKLRDGGVGVGIHYPTPIHQQPLYKGLGYHDSLPIAETASREVLSLPVHPSLTKDDLDCIIETVAKVLNYETILDRPML
ncbi:MAG: DegT/DnrJ/EryC1/StrS family aminotransferase [Anaerolineales bacterium]|uniref:DegT/DnrJ/EryC1/StrS family aminotransferase n=1 Tax=Candidatus Villigracilis TaxID=3140593 RepID=UPI001DF64943|nr:DegT/DnrJ/EryC1/StrS family aminotransferase [Anaerolineales bacterium]MBK7318728.1 DegT/DnrJ/EryC1/StrS family aminotransferase [Anaerolineales bacterium]MBK9603663.1 DegT/DnrJ/EryC1/StrS family aminotransferase [Anaerolineales bacterium]MBL0344072.1 DegT/DnrJ/EryC1/StrS family aminotransferase [Anaerolineales bacterium]